jgi:hypothetical protein
MMNMLARSGLANLRLTGMAAGYPAFAGRIHGSIT